METETLDLPKDSHRVLIFTSKSCSPCSFLKHQLKNALDDELFHKIEFIDGPSNMDLARKHEISRVPHLLILKNEEATVSYGGRATIMNLIEDIKISLML